MHRIDHGCLARNGQRFGDRAHLHHLIELDRSADLDTDALLSHRREPRDGEGHRVLSDGQIFEAVRAVGVGDGQSSSHARGAAGFDRDADEHAACVVPDDASDAAGRGLGRERSGEEQSVRNHAHP